MDAYDAKGTLLAGKIKDQRAARLDPRQVKGVAVGDFEIGSDEDGVAMPADAVLVAAGVGDDEIGLGCDQIGFECCRTLTEALVSLLKRNNIGVELGDDARDAVRVATAVEANAFSHIPGCHTNFRHIRIYVYQRPLFKLMRSPYSQDASR